MKTSWTPNRKVVSGTSWGLFATLLVSIFGQFGIDVTPEVASAIVVIVSTGAGYITRLNKRR